MWLIIAAPVISQSLSPSAATSHLGHGHGGHVHAMGHPSSPPPHDHLLEKCGYCGLLGTSPTLMGAVWLPSILPPVAAMPLFHPVRLPWVRSSSLAAAPRGPPVFVHA